MAAKTYKHLEAHAAKVGLTPAEWLQKLEDMAVKYGPAVLMFLKLFFGGMEKGQVPEARLKGAAHKPGCPPDVCDCCACACMELLGQQEAICKVACANICALSCLEECPEPPPAP